MVLMVYSSKLFLISSALIFGLSVFLNNPYFNYESLTIHKFFLFLSISAVWALSSAVMLAGNCLLIDAQSCQPKALIVPPLFDTELFSMVKAARYSEGGKDLGDGCPVECRFDLCLSSDYYINYWASTIYLSPSFTDMWFKSKEDGILSLLMVALVP